MSQSPTNLTHYYRVDPTVSFFSLHRNRNLPTQWYTQDIIRCHKHEWIVHNQRKDHLLEWLEWYCNNAETSSVLVCCITLQQSLGVVVGMVSWNDIGRSSHFISLQPWSQVVPMQEVELEGNWKLAPSHCLYELHIDPKGLDRHKQYGLLLERSPHPVLSDLLVGPRDRDRFGIFYRTLRSSKCTLWLFPLKQMHPKTTSGTRCWMFNVCEHCLLWVFRHKVASHCQDNR